MNRSTSAFPGVDCAPGLVTEIAAAAAEPGGSGRGGPALREPVSDGGGEAVAGPCRVHGLHGIGGQWRHALVVGDGAAVIAERDHHHAGPRPRR